MEGFRDFREKIRGKTLDGPVSKYINRKVSTRITYLIVKYDIPLTPNMVSLISFGIALACLPLYVLGHLILAGILAQLSSIIDGVDGELARAKGMASKLGGFMDTMLDRYADLAILLGLSIHTLMNYPSTVWAVISVLAVAGDILVSYLHTRAPYDLGVHPVAIGKAENIASRDVRLFIVFIGSLLGLTNYTLLVLAVLTHTYVVLKTIRVINYWQASTQASYT
ncbi:MAG: CDP-alcohol phosphatidyltransferase family protein [Desulfurococcales archaeon]|nr:CDP-alcohol phosphatidyltransferase family protein [Desulfurococcales archaeon]